MSPILTTINVLLGRARGLRRKWLHSDGDLYSYTLPTLHQASPGMGHTPRRLLVRNLTFLAVIGC